MYGCDLREEMFESLYKSLEEVFCVVKFVSFQVGEDTDGTDVATHREVALRTLEAQRDKIDRYFVGLLQCPKYVGRHRSEFYAVTIHEDLLGPGHPVSVEEFLGPGCDLVGRRLLLEECTKNHFNDGFTQAFLDPPYGLFRRVGPELSNTEVHRLFFETLDRLFGGLSENCTIFRWSEDSSNYFDDGQEWWGTYFYTVFVPNCSRIVGVVASATD